ncbi:MAG: prolipoprotein diacylglyceryl transferase [Clostridia bacterium]|nr:prolipoprotein diacylglyceryl transferase [Clostridia bacterium]
MEISSSNLCITLGFIAAVLMAIFCSKQFNIPRIKAVIMIVVNSFGVVAGAKILFLINNLSSIQNGIKVGGLLFYGAVFFFPVYMLFTRAFFKVESKTYYNFSTLGLIIALAFYRIGCFMDGCCCGIPADWGFAMAHSPEVLRVPTQLIELVCDVGIFAILLVAERKNWFNGTKGILYPLFMICYGVIRFVIEFFRMREVLLWGMSQAHFLSLLSIAIGVVWIVLAVKKHNKKASA